MLLKFIIGFVALLPLCQFASACSCIVDPNQIHSTPTYCRTSFLAVVQVIKTQVIAGLQHNYIDLVQELTFGEVKRTSIAGLPTIEDTITSCGHFLQANQTYLIGGYIDDRGQAHLSACGGWIESWPHTGEKSNARVAEYAAKCGSVKS